MNKFSALGIYGGTFSPPHDGHLNAINAFLFECPLDMLYVMPSNVPPHKRIDSHDDPIHRFEMTKLMLKNHAEFGKRLAVSDWEITRKEKSYTVYTLRNFKEYAESLYFLMGTDMLLSLHEWYMPEEICKLATIVFMRREAENDLVNRKIQNQIDFLKQNYGANIITLKSKVLPLDSTSLRSAISKGEQPKGINDRVYDYIKQHRLYGI